MGDLWCLGVVYQIAMSVLMVAVSVIELILEPGGSEATPMNREHQTYLTTIREVRDEHVLELVTEAYLAGVSEYARWKDGTLVVGVSERPWRSVRAEILHLQKVHLEGVTNPTEPRL